MKYLFITALGLFLFAYRHLDHLTRGNPIPWHVPFIEEMTAAWVIGLTAPLAIAMARRFRPSWHTLAVHMAAATGVGVLQTTGFYLARLTVFGLLGLGRYDYGTLWLRYFMEMPLQWISYGVIVGGTVLWDKHRRSELLELENLRLQLQPHFLFNTLNMISAVVYEDPRKADEMLCRLSDYLREALTRKAAQEVSLREEIASARAYLTILEARFEGGPQVEWEIEEGLERAVVPQFLLQPLAENALRHGLEAIRARREGNALVISVEDKGTAADGRGLGIGLGNTRARLQRLYGARGTVELQARDGQGTRVRVSIPFREAA